jgi:hypothetical protein
MTQTDAATLLLGHLILMLEPADVRRARTSSLRHRRHRQSLPATVGTSAGLPDMRTLNCPMP